MSTYKLTKLVKETPINGTIKSCVAQNELNQGDFVTFKKVYSPRWLASLETAHHIYVKKFDEYNFFFAYTYEGLGGAYSCTARIKNIDGTEGSAITIGSNLSAGPNFVSHLLPDGRLFVLFSYVNWGSSNSVSKAYVLRREGMTLIKDIEISSPYGSIKPLSDNKLILFTNSNASILTIGDTSIEVISIGNNNVDILNKNQLAEIVAETDGLYLRVTNIEEATITSGNMIKISDLVNAYGILNIAKVAENKYALIYKSQSASGSSWDVIAVFLSVDDTTLTINSTVTLNFKLNSNSSYVMWEWLSATKAILLFNSGSAIILQFNETSITEGTLTYIGYHSAYGLEVLSESRAIYVSRNSATVLTISGTTIQQGDSVIFQYDPSDSTYSKTVDCPKLSMTKIGRNAVEVIYYLIKDKGYYNVYNVKAVDLIAQGDTIIVNETVTMVNQVFKATSGYAEGLVKTGGKSGETVEVYQVNNI